MRQLFYLLVTAFLPNCKQIRVRAVTTKIMEIFLHKHTYQKADRACNGAIWNSVAKNRNM